MSLLQLALLGTLIGLPLGYALQRTNLCFNTAYREVILHRRTVLLNLIRMGLVKKRTCTGGDRCAGLEQADGDDLHIPGRMAGKLLALRSCPARPPVEGRSQERVEPGPASPNQ